MKTLDFEYTHARVKEERKLYRGLDSIVFGWRGRMQNDEKFFDKLKSDAEKIQARRTSYESLQDHILKEKFVELRQSSERKSDESSNVIDEKLAVLSVISERAMGLKPHTVQLMGALAIARGYLAEMATGEGKTLTISLAAAASAGRKPCHVITANDYLAERDAKILKPLYQFCGNSVSSVIHEMEPEERRQSYLANVTYTTPKEILADFLRDRVQMGSIRHFSRRLLRQLAIGKPTQAQQLVMRGLHTAIVDEADSVLIDEAVTPLILSQPVNQDWLQVACRAAKDFVATLKAGADYDVDFKNKQIHLHPETRKSAAVALSSLPAIWQQQQRRDELLQYALLAREFYHHGLQYAILEGKIELIDEFTGRIMPQRTWQQGLHQAVEAKEGLEITPANETLASLSFQRFYRCFPKLSGVSGTLWEARDELWQMYQLPVVKIPTHRPCIRVVKPERYFDKEEAKWEAVVEETVECQKRGQPVLIGSRSVRASEVLAQMFEKRGLRFQLLNAVQHAREAEIVAQAGQLGAITIATNMAGRGTDIALAPEVHGLGGLHVIATERHESARIDRQLFGRSARQGDPGSVQMFVSFEDELMKRYVPQQILKWVFKDFSNGELSGKKVKWGKAGFDYAQSVAQRMAYLARRQVLEADVWLDENLTFAGRTSIV